MGITITEAKTIIEQQKQLLQQKRQEQEQAQKELTKQQASLPDVTSQTALRKKFTGLAGRTKRQQIEGIGKQIGAKQKVVKEFGTYLGEYEGKIIEAEQQVAEAEATIGAETGAFESARKYFNQNVPPDMVRGEPAHKYLVMMYENYASSEQALQDIVDTAQNSGVDISVNWKTQRITGISSDLGDFSNVESYNKAVEKFNIALKETPKVEDINRFLPRGDKILTSSNPFQSDLIPLASASPVVATMGVSLGDNIIGTGTYSKAPSWLGRIVESYKEQVKTSGDVVQAGLNVLGGAAQSEYDKYIQEQAAKGNLAVYSGASDIKNVLGLAPNVAYFTPAGPALLLGGGVSKLVAYGVKPEILTRKAESLQQFAGGYGVPIGERASKGVVVTAALGEAGLGLFGLKTQYENIQIAKAKPQTTFYAEVQPTQKGTKVNLLSTTRGKGIKENLAFGQQVVRQSPIDESISISAGKTYTYTKTKEGAEIIKSSQIGGIKQGTGGTIWTADVGGVKVGVPSDTSMFIKGVSKNIKGVKLKEVSWLDDLVPSKLSVDKTITTQKTAGLVFPKTSKVTGQGIGTGSNYLDDMVKVTFIEKTPDEFIFIGGTPSKLRIYKAGKSSLIVKPNIKGVIKVLPDELGVVDTSKIFTKTTSGTVLKPSIQKAISVFPTAEKTFKTTPLIPSTSILDIKPSTKTEMVSLVTAKTTQETKSITGQVIMDIPKQRDINVLKYEEPTKQRERVIVKTIQVPKTIQEERLRFVEEGKTKQVLSEVTKSKELQLFKQQQVSKLKEKQRAKIITTTTQPKPITPRVPPPIVKFGLGKALAKAKQIPEAEIEVYGRRFGKDISLFKGKDKQKAESVLDKFLRGTLGRSGYLTAGGEKVQSSLLKSHIYRKSKVEPLRVVQKSIYSISSQGEKGELLGYRKRKAKDRRKNNFVGVSNLGKVKSAKGKVTPNLKPKQAVYGSETIFFNNKSKGKTKKEREKDLLLGFTDF